MAGCDAVAGIQIVLRPVPQLLIQTQFAEREQQYGILFVLDEPFFGCSICAITSLDWQSPYSATSSLSHCAFRLSVSICCARVTAELSGTPRRHPCGGCASEPPPC